MVLSAATQAAPVMTADTLTFLRAFPTPATPFNVRDPVNQTTTVANDPSDQINWAAGGFTLQIDPGANNIGFGFLQNTGWGTSGAIFDGFVITGFSQDISSTALISNTVGAGVTLSHTARQLLVGLNGSSTIGTFNFSVGFAEPAAVSAPGTLALTGLAVLALVAQRQRSHTNAPR